MIDVNVWVSFALANQYSRSGTASQAVVGSATSMRAGTRPLQLVVSAEMADTLDRVLQRVGFSPAVADRFSASLIDLTRAGPERLNPFLLVAGRDQLALRDREDAGVLAAAIASRADLLVTDNIDDFRMKDAVAFNTQCLPTAHGTRQLFALVHERRDGIALVVAHPVDVAEWLRAGRDISPAMIRRTYGKIRKSQ